MKEKILENEKIAEPSLKQLSSKDASRILDNVLSVCGMPPCKIPFEVLEERVRERKETVRKEKYYDWESIFKTDKAGTAQTVACTGTGAEKAGRSDV